MSHVVQVKLISYSGPASDIETVMYALDKIDPQFRIITDQLFFTDRTDLDLSNYLDLLGKQDDKYQYNYHYDYLWDRFIRSAEIFWEESFWVHRFDLILSWNFKKLEKDIENHLINKFKSLIATHYDASPKIHNPYIQIIAWSKAKFSRKENLTPLKDLLLELPNTTQTAKVVSIAKKFIPQLFQDLEEYISIISKKVGQSSRSFDVLRELEKQGIAVDKSPMFKLSQDLLAKRVPNRKNRRSFFTMLNDPSVMTHLKTNYLPEHRARLISLIKECDFREIEENHLRNIKNLLELDSSIADELISTYADRLYARGTGHKKANVMRLIRACKTFSQFSPKKVLSYLSSHNRMSDIKYLILAFPDIKILIPFV